MHIVADRVIANAEQVFSAYGEVTLFDGRLLNPEIAKSADVLLVRSVTPVDRQLLESSRIKFVGTATAGIDHIATQALEDAGIEFASAPGCNANAVAEYILTSVLVFCSTYQLDPDSLSVGIIGHGEVGSRVACKLTAIGMTCLVNDPPKALIGETRHYVPLDEALSADIVTIHTPLVEHGAFATKYLIGASELRLLSKCRLLINAARGGIIDEPSLIGALDVNRDLQVQIDCWENEPQVNLPLLKRCWQASAHIAGHTVEARLNASKMLAQALSAWSGITNPWSQNDFCDDQKDRPDQTLSMMNEYDTQSKMQILANTLATYCPIDKFHLAMGELNVGGQVMRAQKFDEIRRRFAGRREFSYYKIPQALAASFSNEELTQIGFSQR